MGVGYKLKDGKISVEVLIHSHLQILALGSLISGELSVKILPEDKSYRLLEARLYLDQVLLYEEGFGGDQLEVHWC